MKSRSEIKYYLEENRSKFNHILQLYLSIWFADPANEGKEPFISIKIFPFDPNRNKTKTITDIPSIDEKLKNTHQITKKVRVKKTRKTYIKKNRLFNGISDVYVSKTDEKVISTEIVEEKVDVNFDDTHYISIKQHSTFDPITINTIVRDGDVRMNTMTYLEKLKPEDQMDEGDILISANNPLSISSSYADEEQMINLLMSDKTILLKKGIKPIMVDAETQTDTITPNENTVFLNVTERKENKTGIDLNNDKPQLVIDKTKLVRSKPIDTNKINVNIDMIADRINNNGFTDEDHEKYNEYRQSRDDDDGDDI